jgi:hypothetical protein
LHARSGSGRCRWRGRLRAGGHRNGLAGCLHMSILTPRGPAGVQRGVYAV